MAVVTITDDGSTIKVVKDGNVVQIAKPVTIQKAPKDEVILEDQAGKKVYFFYADVTVPVEASIDDLIDAIEDMNDVAAGGAGATEATQLAVLAAVDGLEAKTDAVKASVDAVKDEVDNVEEELANIKTELQTSNQEYAIRQDEDATHRWTGLATPGSATSAAVWQISRETIADGTVLWADGDSNFNNIWNDHLTLTYS